MFKNNFTHFSLCCADRLLSFDRPAVMGIVNCTADSFYDGGTHASVPEAVDFAKALHDEGADILDLGVVSTRPGAALLSPDDEAHRLATLVSAVRSALPDAVISVDTCFSLPAKAAVQAGADIINDISGGAFDPLMFDVVAQLRTPYILMHNTLASADNPSGRSDASRHNRSADQLLNELALFFSSSLNQLETRGVRDVIIDPGFGFSKSLDENYSVLSLLPELRRLFPNNPLLVALSRKSMIYKALDITPADALTGTVALHAVALLSGAQLLRVHDVRDARQTSAIISKLYR